ncbi:phosphotransferase [Kocuria sp.]|uniref:phosphotransferase n=1 Tax=Kocuria sp. TaxID=1871328 RepID=UPI0026DF2807|nr:phosphotransferase [Kocuria sp.]MDO5617442.1 phosphotransferase [Kocuria sp.]
MVGDGGQLGQPSLPISADRLPGVAWILDPKKLVPLFAGAELTAETSYLRYKPGFTAVARLDITSHADGSPETSTRWVATYAPEAATKLHKAVAKARELYGLAGAELITVREVPGHPGHVLAVGRLAADPKLAEILRTTLGSAALEVGSPGSPWGLLRFNPLRRLVLADASGKNSPSTVVKLSARVPSATPTVAQLLAARGIPVQTTVTCPHLPADDRVQCYPWFGDGDLSTRPSEDRTLKAAHMAGAGLAGMHGADVGLLAVEQLPAPQDPRARLTAMANDLAHLDADVAQKFTAVSGRVLEELRTDLPAVLLHGDFSADQVLVDDSGPEQSVLITDLDRLRVGVAADDVGNAVSAVVLPHAIGEGHTARFDQRHVQLNPVMTAVLQGYREAAAPSHLEAPEDHQIRAWAAFHLLMRVMEPFRNCHPAWATQMRQIMDSAAALVPVTVPAAVTQGVGERMTVKRAWPKADGGLTAELIDPAGRVRAAVCTPDPAVLGLPRWKVNPYGEDHKFPGLRQLADQGQVVVHRRARRAVVAMQDRYVKLLAGEKAEPAARLSHTLHELGTAAGFDVPRVLAAAADRVEFSVLPGHSLHRVGADTDLAVYTTGFHAWAQCWPALVRAEVPPGQLPEYTAADEVNTLTGWVQRLEAFPWCLGVPVAAWTRTVETISQRLLDLAPLDSAQHGMAPRDLAWRDLAQRGRAHGAAPMAAGIPRGVVHRDLHEKQLLVDAATSRIGLLDFDTAAVGDPALDLANLGVHLDLHRDQGLLSPALHRVGHQAVGTVAQELKISAEHLRAYRAATRARLVCVYAFRPQWVGLARTWAEHLVREMVAEV